MVITLPYNLSFPLFFSCLYGITGFVLFFFYTKKQSAIKRHLLAAEQMQEESNIYQEQIKEKEEYLKSMPLRMQKLNTFRVVIEDIASFEMPQQICEYLTHKVKEVFHQNDRTLLFLVEDESKVLKLTSVAKEDRNYIIQEKEGDIFDYWVLKHNRGLFIEDLAKDFRFDLEKIEGLKSRVVNSLIEAPLALGKRILGTLRAESREKNAFRIEDLRALSIIADIGAVALDKSFIFRRTQEMAIHDGITGLYLKGFFMDRLKQEIKRSLINSTSFFLFMVDIDDFKKLNDQYGHIAGDMILKKIADILTQVIGNSGNIISRFGGEEFIVLLLAENLEQAYKVAERVRSEIQKASIELRRTKILATVSIGISSFPAESKFFEELVRIADSRMYKAKKQGKNRVCCMG